MNNDTRIIITNSASELWEIFNSTNRPKLKRPKSTAIQVLDELKNGGSIEELAKNLGLHINTVFGYITALEEGNIAIVRTNIPVKDNSIGGRNNLHFSLKVPEHVQPIKRNTNVVNDINPSTIHSTPQIQAINNRIDTEQTPRIISRKTTRHMLGTLPPKQHYQLLPIKKGKYWIWEDRDTSIFRICSPIKDPWTQKEWVFMTGLQNMKADNSQYPYQCRLLLIPPEETKHNDLRVSIYREEIKGVFASTNEHTIQYFPFPHENKKHIWITYSFVLKNGIYYLQN